MKKRTLLLILLMVCSPVFIYGQMTPQKAIQQYRSENEAEILQEFRELLKIPNVASDTKNMRRNAAWIMDAFEQHGVEMEFLLFPYWKGNVY